MVMVTDEPLLKCMMVPCWMLSLVPLAAAAAGLIFFAGASPVSDSLLLPDESDDATLNFAA
eukprot:1288787-Amphidinium_carterae.1